MSGLIYQCLLLVLLVHTCSCKPASKWIDMTYKFDNTTIYWPTATKFKHTLVFKGQKELFYYSSYDISGSEHGGTHLDAPIHFSAGKWTTDQIPLDNLIGDAVVVDMTAKASKDRDAQLTADDLKAWEEKHGRIPDDAVLLLWTGWGKHWPNAKEYLGTDTNDTSKLHFPGMHESAAQWIVDNRKIKLFGIDTASLDHGPSKNFTTHQILFKKNIPALENVANLDKLPTKGATVYAAVQLIKDGSGGPCRVFATINKSATGGAIATAAAYKALMYLSVVLVNGIINGY